MLINLILFFSWQASCARIIYLCSLKSDGSVPYIFIPLKNMWHLKFCNHKKSRIKRHRGPLESNSVLCHECKPPLDLAQGLWHVWCPSAVCQVVTEAHLSLVNNHHERERVRAIVFHEILETGAIHKETRKKFFEFFSQLFFGHGTWRSCTERRSPIIFCCFESKNWKTCSEARDGRESHFKTFLHSPIACR